MCMLGDRPPQTQAHVHAWRQTDSRHRHMCMLGDRPPQTQAHVHAWRQTDSRPVVLKFDIR